MEKQAQKKEQDDFLEYANGHEGFADWLRQVDRLCISRWGQGIFDLGDMNMRDAFEAGTHPKDFVGEEVAEMVREEFGEEMADGGEEDNERFSPE